MPSIFNPDRLHHLCQKYGLRPSKKYGQNFLINSEPIERMIEAVELTTEDIVIEVGPGFGVLTLPLAERAQKVIAFEIEKRLQPYWEEQVKKYKNIELVWGNALRRWRDLSLTLSSAEERRRFLPSFPAAAGPRLAGGGAEEGTGGAVSLSYKVAANLPYQITSPFIREFLETEHPPRLMVLMVQKEVAERICARPGDMSLLSVAVQYYAEPVIVAYVPRSYFWPEPEVDSAVIRLRPRDLPAVPPFLKGGAERSAPSPLKEERAARPAFAFGEADGGRGERSRERAFFKLVKAGFARRRKLLIKNLESLVGKKNRSVLADAFTQIGLLATARAQELSVEQWQQLSTYLDKALVL